MQAPQHYGAGFQAPAPWTGHEHPHPSPNPALYPAPYPPQNDPGYSHGYPQPAADMHVHHPQPPEAHSNTRFTSVQDAINSAMAGSPSANRVSFQRASPGKEDLRMSMVKPVKVRDLTTEALATLPVHLQAAVIPPLVPPGVDPICGPLYAKPTPPNVLAVSIHRVDTFRPDTMVTNPVVRLHVLDPATGDYMQSLMTQGVPVDAATQAHMLRFPGRPATVTVGHNTPALQEYLPPVQTAPYDMLRRATAGATAVWNEMLLVDEALERLIALDALLIFEILQLPVTFHRYMKHPDQFPAGTHRVAWAFLRLAGSSAGGADTGLEAGSLPHSKGPLVGNLKLQLYHYRAPPVLGRAAVVEAEEKLASAPTRAFTAWKALTSNSAGTGALGHGLIDRYPAALHVTVDACPRPPPEVVKIDPSKNLRAVLPAGYGSGFEEGSVPLLQFMVQTFGVGASGAAGGMGGAGSARALELSPYYRSKGQPCHLPNHRWKLLSTAPGGGCCAAFSNDGSRVAVAVGEGLKIDNFHIIIYSVLTGTELARFHCAHQGWVHVLAWSHDDTCLISASSDRTVKVWEMALFQTSSRSIKPRVLRHPCSVYAAAFHPQPNTHPFIVTGGKNGSLFLWHRFSGQPLAAISPADTPAVSTSRTLTRNKTGVRQDKPLGELSGAVHAITWDPHGSRLWAGDAQGTIQEFSLDAAAVKQAVAQVMAGKSLLDLHNAPACNQSPGAPAAYQSPPSGLYKQQAAVDGAYQGGAPAAQPHPPYPPTYPGAPPPNPPGPVQYMDGSPPAHHSPPYHPGQAALPASQYSSQFPVAPPGSYHPDVPQQRHQAMPPQGPYAPLPPPTVPVPTSVAGLWVPQLPPERYSVWSDRASAPVTHTEQRWQQWQQQQQLHIPGPDAGDPVSQAVLHQQRLSQRGTPASQTHPSQHLPSPSPLPPPAFHTSIEVSAGVNRGPGPLGEATESWTAAYPSGAQNQQVPLGVTPAQPGYLQQQQYTPRPGPPQQYAPQPGPPQQYAPQPGPPQQYTPQPGPPQQYAPQPGGPPQQYAPQPGPPQQYAPQPGPPQQYAPQPGPPQQYPAQGPPLQQHLPQSPPGLYSPPTPPQAPPAPYFTPSPTKGTPDVSEGCSFPTSPLLRPMRSCKALAGQPCASIQLHPAGRKLVVMTQCNRLVTLDTRVFKDTRELGRVHCKDALVKASCSPDGQFVLAGGEDGMVRVWDAATTSLDPSSRSMSHLALGGPGLGTAPKPVLCTAWNPQLHMVAVCGWGSWAPLLLAVYDKTKPAVVFQQERAACDTVTHHDQALPTRKYELPDKLTPALVHALMADVRAGARKRGVLPSQPLDTSVCAFTPPGHSLRLQGPNDRGAYGEPFPHPMADQMTIPRPRENPWQQQQRLLAAKAAEAEHEEARLASRLSFSQVSAPVIPASTPSLVAAPAAGVGTAAQTAISATPTSVPGVDGGAVSSVSLVAYAPGSIHAADALDTKNGAAFSAAPSVVPCPPGPSNSAGSPPSLQTYVPDLKAGVKDAPAGVRESQLLQGLQDHKAVPSPPVPSSRPTPLHQMPELQNKGFSAALPPQQQYPQPIMAGPGTTVVVGPGATVIAHPGAQVMPVTDPMAGHTPNVSQRAYKMNLDQPLVETPKAVAVASPTALAAAAPSSADPLGSNANQATAAVPVKAASPGMVTAAATEVATGKQVLVQGASPGEARSGSDLLKPPVVASAQLASSSTSIPSSPAQPSPAQPSVAPRSVKDIISPRDEAAVGSSSPKTAPASPIPNPAASSAAEGSTGSPIAASTAISSPSHIASMKDPVVNALGHVVSNSSTAGDAAVATPREPAAPSSAAGNASKGGLTSAVSSNLAVQASSEGPSKQDAPAPPSSTTAPAGV